MTHVVAGRKTKKAYEREGEKTESLAPPLIITCRTDQGEEFPGRGGGETKGRGGEGKVTQRLTHLRDPHQSEVMKFQGEGGRGGTGKKEKNLYRSKKEAV